MPASGHQDKLEATRAHTLGSDPHHVVAVLSDGLADACGVVIAAVLLEQQVEAPAATKSNTGITITLNAATMMQAFGDWQSLLDKSAGDIWGTAGVAASTPA